MTTITLCDRCGKEVDCGDEWWRSFVFSFPMLGFYGKTVSLCRRCRKDFCSWLKFKKDRKNDRGAK